MNPTPITITSDDINRFLSFTDMVVGDFKITTTGTANYEQAVNITVKNSSGNGDVSGSGFETAIKCMQLFSLIDGANTVIDGKITAKTSGNEAMVVKLKVTPTSPNKFDVVEGVSQEGALSITLSFKPSAQAQWAQ